MPFAKPAETLRSQLSGNSDVNGNAVLTLAGNYELSRNAAWNLFVQLQGILNGVVTILVDGLPVDGGLTTNRQFKCGPVFTNQNSQLQVTVTGMAPNQPVAVSMQGILSENVADFASLGSPGYGGGSVQNDPSQLLTAQTGTPLIENVTAQIPHLGLNPNYLEFGANYPNGLGGGIPPNGNLIPFNIAGYSALFIDVDPNTALNDLWMIIFWQDALGNLITTTEIGSLCPLFRGLVIAHGSQCTIWIINNGAVNHGIANFTIIPYVQVPPRPDLLLDNGPNITPITPASLDSHYLIATNLSIPAGTNQSTTALFVWNGKAKLNVSVNPTNVFHAKLTGVDALGNSVDFADVWSPAGVQVAPVEVQLPSSLVTLDVANNNGTGTISPAVALVATS